jgi:hypothetical protein
MDEAKLESLSALVARPIPRTREELEALLRRAGELEQVLMCAYLFTAYTLKQDASEGGFSADPATRARELAAVARWKGQITGVAVQEMLHLALVSNVLSAVGGHPDFGAAGLGFPLSPRTMQETFGYDGKAWLGLWPFSALTVERFAWYEDFEPGPFPGPPWSAGEAPRSGPVFLRGLEQLRISTLVELYEDIALGLVALAAELGEGKLFPPANRLHQVTDAEVTGLFNFPPATAMAGGKLENRPLLNAVDGLQSALTAINTVIVQGEGDTQSWQQFIQRLPIPPGDKVFPVIHTPSHHLTFKQILQGVPEVVGNDPAQVHPASPGLLELQRADSAFAPARPVPENPLPADRCAGDPACRAHVHVIQDPFTREVSELEDGLYRATLDLLDLGFNHRSAAGDDSVRRYEKASLVQASIRAMVYVVAPVGNMLAQLAGDATGSWNAGPAFSVYSGPPATWEETERRLVGLSLRAEELARRAPRQVVWLSPSYLDIPAPGNVYPRQSVGGFLARWVAPDLQFMADRMERVHGRAPRPGFDPHVCHGLNACAGQDITGTAPRAGAGACATADPHVCSGQNHCRGQGGCGFSPSPSGAWALQNHPGQNDYAGQIRDADGYYQFNPQADSACGSPILPSLKNTYGFNTPPAAGRGGDPAVYGEAHGYVWELARLLFEKKMRTQGTAFDASYGGNARYRRAGAGENA